MFQVWFWELTMELRSRFLHNELTAQIMDKFRLVDLSMGYGRYDGSLTHDGMVWTTN